MATGAERKGTKTRISPSTRVARLRETDSCEGVRRALGETPEEGEGSRFPTSVVKLQSMVRILRGSCSM